MADIFIEYKGRGIKEKKIKTITTDNINSVIVELKFDAEWEQYSQKVVVFSANERTAYKKYLDENNKCIVPWEVLEQPGNITLGVVGVSEDKVYTSVLASIPIHQGRNINAEIPGEPAENLIIQIEKLKTQLASLEEELRITQKEVNEFDEIVEPDENGINTIYIHGGLI